MMPLQDTYKFSLLNMTSYSRQCLKFEATPKYSVFVLPYQVF